MTLAASEMPCLASAGLSLQPRRESVRRPITNVSNGSLLPYHSCGQRKPRVQPFRSYGREKRDARCSSSHSTFRPFITSSSEGCSHGESHAKATGRGQRFAAASAAGESQTASSTLTGASDGISEVKAVLFDMDGVLCNSELVSRQAAAEVMKELYDLDVSPEEFAPFTGTGEANFLGGVARKYGAPFEVESCKEKFFEIYMSKYAVPGAGIGYKGARELVESCRAAGLKTAVASSADLIKVHANLRAANIPLDIFDTIVSADAFERLKPFPDIFLTAASNLGIDPSSCVVIEDAVAGVQAARAAGMRVIGVSTTLPELSMQEAGPDALLNDISAISVETLRGLRLRDGGEEAIAAARKKIETTDESKPHPTPSVLTTSSNEPSIDLDTTSIGPHASKSIDDLTTSVNIWLENTVPLPGGYRMTRRDVLKTLSLGGAVASGWVALTRLKANPLVRDGLLRLHLPVLVQLGIIAYVLLAWPYWSKSLSYASPKAVFKALFPGTSPASITGQYGSSADRVAAFKRFIADVERRQAGERVPEFPEDADWLNAPPLRLSRELSGKIVLLDFWTFCCINCMHVLPDLAYLERKYSDRPVHVVGVHSAKFDAEADTEAIRNAVLRYDILHPVVNDRGMVLWRALGISSWPTIALVSPTGRLLLSLSGENHRRDLDDAIAAALEFYDEQGLLNDAPVPTSLEKDKDPVLVSSPLRFPGKVAVDRENNRIFVSDSGNHRILAINAIDGACINSVGGNGPGLWDGPFESAAFNRPQGLCYCTRSGVLYVCDTESHAVRKVDFERRIVTTLAGNGRKGDDYRGGRARRDQALNSPWDCCIVYGKDGHHHGDLMVAMAGLHQIWRVDTESGKAEAFSGTGAERNQNGPTSATTAWAQPSGIALLPSMSADDPEDVIIVADAESSSIRKLDLRTGGSSLCVGGDPLFPDNLFRFGDEDGQGSSALLQHPLGVCSSIDGRYIFVADSYNNKIKALDPITCSIKTIAGGGGLVDGAKSNASFSEPGGVAVLRDGRVLVADTNNGALRIVDPNSGQVNTFLVKDVPPPRGSQRASGISETNDEEDLVAEVPGAAVVASSSPIEGTSGCIRIGISLPPGYHLTPGANSRFECASMSNDVVFEPKAARLIEDGRGNVLANVRYSGAQEPTKIRILATVYYCQDRSVCLFQEVAFFAGIQPSSSFGQRGDREGSVSFEYMLSSTAATVNDDPLSVELSTFDG